MIVLLFLSLVNVTVGPGWNTPIVVTEEPNSNAPYQFITQDNQGRFHLTWEELNDVARIGYKVFLLDGTTVFPETMISRDVNSFYLSDIQLGDSLFVFWREYNPVYYSIRSLEDCSEITPATYLFTEFTNYQEIRFSSDSLGRLHVVRNIGQDVYYAVWTPAPGSGFIEEYGWFITEAWIIGMVLVDGDRVHLILGDSDQTYMYIQYDLEGNVTVPCWDFTNDEWSLDKYPGLAVDCNGDLIVVSDVGEGGSPRRYCMWKIDGVTGNLLAQEWLVISQVPDMETSKDMSLVPFPDHEKFYLVWGDGWFRKKLWFIVFDNEGNVILEPTAAYDHTDEDPEQLSNPDAVSDSLGNLYVIYNQVEDQPIFGGYPTFGWFNVDSLGIEEGESPELEPSLISITPSCNPFCGSVEFLINGGSISELSVHDITGRIVTEIPVSHGVAAWDGRNSEGEELSPGVYIVCGNDCESVLVTLLRD